MIELRNLSKSYRTRFGRKVVARDINFTFPTGESVALIGGNGAGKSTMLKMIAGTLRPDHGEVISDGTISWPVGFAGSFHGDLTGAQNVKFCARIYGVDTEEMLDFTKSFSELGAHFHLPVRTYSSGMKSRLAFAMSMAIPFDTYLVDEVTAVGDASFRKKSEEILMERLQHSGAIVVSHSMEQLARLCTSGVVLSNGWLFHYPQVEKAIEHHRYNMQGKRPPWLA